MKDRLKESLAYWFTQQKERYHLTGTQIASHLGKNGVRASVQYLHKVSREGMSYAKAAEIAEAMGWHLPTLESLPIVVDGKPYDSKLGVKHLYPNEGNLINSLELNTEDLPKTLALHQVQDDSMEPTVSPQDTLLLDTSRTELNSDGLYLINYYDSTLLRRIQYIPGEGYRAISDNQIYEPFPLQIAKVEVKARVIGKLSFSTL